MRSLVLQKLPMFCLDDLFGSFLIAYVEEICDFHEIYSTNSGIDGVISRFLHIYFPPSKHCSGDTHANRIFWHPMYLSGYHRPFFEFRKFFYFLFFKSIFCVSILLSNDFSFIFFLIVSQVSCLIVHSEVSERHKFGRHKLIFIVAAINQPSIHTVYIQQFERCLFVMKTTGSRS